MPHPPISIQDEALELLLQGCLAPVLQALQAIHSELNDMRKEAKCDMAIPAEKHFPVNGGLVLGKASVPNSFVKLVGVTDVTLVEEVEVKGATDTQESPAGAVIESRKAVEVTSAGAPPEKLPLVTSSDVTPETGAPQGDRPVCETILPGGSKEGTSLTMKQVIEEVKRIGRTTSKKTDFYFHSHMFQDVHEMKEAVLHNALRNRDILHFHHPSGIFRDIASSHWFEPLSLCVTGVNSLWIAVDADINGSKALTEKPFFYQFVEFAFVAFFLGEWLVRLLALQKKLDGLRDTWFVFDGTLVFLMCVDTGMALFIDGHGGKTGILRLVRLVKITRLARMARILRKWPELEVLARAIWVAGRSVLSTVIFLTILAYVFSVAFRFLTMDSAMGEKHFSSVPNGVKNLLLPAVFPDMLEIITDMGEVGFVTEVLAIVFCLISVMTLMNMLIGILCEVIASTAAVEKHSIRTNHVKQQLLQVLERSELEASLDMKLNKQQFRRLMVNPDAVQVLRDAEVDPLGLVEFTEYIFGKECDEESAEPELTFERILDMVMNLNGTNTATVKDVVDMRRILLLQLHRIEAAVGCLPR